MIRASSSASQLSNGSLSAAKEKRERLVETRNGTKRREMDDVADTIAHSHVYTRTAHTDALDLLLADGLAILTTMAPKPRNFQHRFTPATIGAKSTTMAADDNSPLFSFMSIESRGSEVGGFGAAECSGVGGSELSTTGDGRLSEPAAGVGAAAAAVGDDDGDEAATESATLAGPRKLPGTNSIASTFNLEKVVLISASLSWAMVCCLCAHYLWTLENQLASAKNQLFLGYKNSPEKTAHAA